MTEKKQTQKKEQQPNQVIATLQKTIADSVLVRVQQFTVNKDIRLPGDYSPENALKSAWLVLLETKDKNKNPVLQVCTRESIANALLNMVLQGLSPVKKQCDFIAYGDKLTLQREYHGTIALAKRYGEVKEPVGNVVYEGDEFEYSIDIKGYKTIVKHIQSLENIDPNNIKGAYATLLFKDEARQPYVEIMTMQQIRQSWMQGETKGASPAHKNFPDQMAIKTVISRACKLFITSSDDSVLFDDDEKDSFAETAKQKIQAGANQEEITMDIPTEVVNNDNGKNKPESIIINNDEPEEVSSESGAEADDLSQLGKQRPGF